MKVMFPAMRGMIGKCQYYATIMALSISQSRPAKWS